MANAHHLPAFAFCRPGFLCLQVVVNHRITGFGSFQPDMEKARDVGTQKQQNCGFDAELSLDCLRVALRAVLQVPWNQPESGGVCQVSP